MEGKLTQVPPRDHRVWKTPLYEQYWRLKDQAPGCLLFFRLGDFYELFGEDAVLAAPLLEVQLTARNKNDDSPVPMCGVPAHAIDSYAEKLLGAGLKVALGEQLQDPSETKAKIVERGIVRILTPGLPVDPDRLEARESHFLVSLAKYPGAVKPVELVVFDFLGGRLFTGRLEEGAELASVLRRLKVRELLVDPSDEGVDFGPETAKLKTLWSGANARDRLESYLLYTQRCGAEGLKRLLPDTEPLAKLTGRASAAFARLPAPVVEQWAIDSHLAPLLDRCGSAVGSRMLREVLAAPLRDVPRLMRRQGLWRAFANAEEFLATAAQVYDFERCLGRFRVGVAAPRELFRVLLSLRALEESFRRAGPETLRALEAVAGDERLPSRSALAESLRPLGETLERALDVERDVARSDALSVLLKTGFDNEMDRLKDLLENSEAWLASFEARLQTETAIPSLKVRYNRVFGYYIEVTKTHLAKVPAHFERKQTTVGGERFTCEELRSRETEILSAQSKAEARARHLLEELQKSLLAKESELRDYIRHFAWLDAIAGARVAVARLERHGPWNLASLREGPASFQLVEGRHPIVEAVAGSFVANSLTLSSSDTRLILLTGPNMAGKSTFMRQVGVCLLLAQCGFPVPAERLELSPVSGFFSRMGASDRIFEGESTFMVEMREAAEILRDADEESFILIDEIGRGTGTRDGLAIARAILEHLHAVTKGLTIFATHFRELAVDAEKLSGARNASLGIREWEGELVFLRRLVFEAAESSYGIHVAEMAGLPAKLLERARSLFGTTELPKIPQAESPPPMNTPPPAASRARKSGRSASDNGQVSLFDRAKIEA